MSKKALTSGSEGVIALPVGREAHTCLHHIVGAAGSLAEWMIFCQGKPFGSYRFQEISSGFCLERIKSGQILPNHHLTRTLIAS